MVHRINLDRKAIRQRDKLDEIAQREQAETERHHDVEPEHRDISVGLRWPEFATKTVMS